jgi:predicted ATPase
MMRLKRISLLRERVTGPREYPFTIPSIGSLDFIDITSPVCFFVGENGTGKSTLLEAIAAHYGFGLEGGNRNYSPKTTESVRSSEPLVKALRLSFTKRTGGGFYLRAEVNRSVSGLCILSVQILSVASTIFHRCHDRCCIIFSMAAHFLLHSPEVYSSPHTMFRLLSYTASYF